MKRKMKKMTGFSLHKVIHERIMGLPKHLRKDEEVLRYVRANIPREYWDITINDFKGNNKAASLVKKYLKKLDGAYEEGLGFLFTGGNGVGKTTLQMLILKEALDRGYSAFHITLPEIFHYIKLGFDDHNILLEIHNILRTTDFLAVGELGKSYHRKGSELFMVSEFDMLFRHRRSVMLPTSLDTNMDLTEMHDTYGESLMSLFSGCLKEVAMKGRDYRKTTQKGIVDGFFK